MASETLDEKNLNQDANPKLDEQAEPDAQLNEAPVEEAPAEGELPVEEQKEAEDVEASDEDEVKEIKTPVKAVKSEEKGRKRNTKGDGEDSSQKKRRRATPKSAEPVTPLRRPSRERKVVERFAVPSSEKASATKTVEIQKGHGTPLKDIPNVAFKLSKRKADENLNLLHTILFGKKTKIHSLKRNILQFSGFVWGENEEKQRTKIKEKLDKCIKEKLLDFCDVLDIPVSKTATKKDEVTAKILEFLESPHRTTDILLAEKEQLRKLKRKQKAGSSGRSSSKDSSSKKRKKLAEGKKKELTPKSEEYSEDDSEAESESAGKHLSDEDNNAVTVDKDESEHEDEESPEEDNTDVKEGKKSSGRATLKRCTESKVVVDDSPSKLTKSTEPEKSPIKPMQSPTKSLGSSDKPKESPSKFVQKKGPKNNDKVSGSHPKPKEGKDSTSKNPKSTEKKSKLNESSVPEKKKRSKKEQNKSGIKASNKKDSKKTVVAEPSREEMHAAVTGILREVDFNTATLTDILKKLENLFSTNLVHRKSEVRTIIEEVISNMTDDEDEGEEDAGNGSEGEDENTDN